MPLGFAIDVHGDIRQRLPHQQAGDATGEFDHLHASLHRRSRFGQSLAMFARDDAGQLFGIAIQKIAKAEEKPGPVDGRRGGPSWQRLDCRLHSLIDQRGSA